MSDAKHLSSPSYSPQPRRGFEERIALINLTRARHRPRADLITRSKAGVILLRLEDVEQHDNIPVYTAGEAVRGHVELLKADNVVSVELKIEGTLQVQEIGEGGNSSHELCSHRFILWNKDDGLPHPPSFPFSYKLPSTFSNQLGAHPLPATYECNLEGFPGFRAKSEYMLYVTVNQARNRNNLFGFVNLPALAIPLIYFPRSRPAVPLPPLLKSINIQPGLQETPQWRCYPKTLKAKNSMQDIETRLYVPASRIFSITHSIPFFLTFTASSVALAAFLPLGPTPTLLSVTNHATQIRLLRQCIVDNTNPAVIPSKKTEIWNLQPIGEGSFRFLSDGPNWITFAGEIPVASHIKIPGFKIISLVVRDFISLTMNPPDPAKTPFKELRLSVPIQLTTDPWDGEQGPGTSVQTTSVDSDSLGDILDQQPELTSAQ